MLIQFNFQNFRSFKDETSLDMTATRISEYPEHVVNIANEKILPVAAIFGANASGKSNSFKAFSFMTYYVANSFYFGDEKENGKVKGPEMILSEPYLLDNDSSSKASTFEVFFTDNEDPKGKTYQYGFSIMGREIIEEWFYSKARTARNKYITIFYRKKGTEFECGGLGAHAAENLKASLNKETLIVSLGAKLKISKLKKARDWFLKNEVIDFGDPGENFIRSRMLPEHFVDSVDVQKKVAEYFDTFDSSIKGFRVTEIKSENEEKHSADYRIEVLHKPGDIEQDKPIELSDESSGTLKMFALYPVLSGVFYNGGVMFVDELNARLHPLLARNIILTFLNPQINTNHAQLIFTTHDVWQFSNELLRRDELWLTEKDSNGATSLYSVVDFKDSEGNKARKFEALQKNYLVGEYGGIPVLKPLVMLKGKEPDGRKK